MFTDMAQKLGTKQNSASLMQMVKGFRNRKARKHCAVDNTKMNIHAAYFKTTFGAEPDGTRLVEDVP